MTNILSTKIQSINKMHISIQLNTDQQNVGINLPYLVQTHVQPMFNPPYYTFFQGVSMATNALQCLICSFNPMTSKWHLALHGNHRYEKHNNAFSI